MENYLPISFLNDFIFCPRSIYFHQLYGKVKEEFYQTKVQIDGHAAHKNIDEKKYSTSTKILQAIDIYSEKYKLCGKIDLFEMDKHLLIERKKKIKVIYDGYIFQLYAQYFALSEMGYNVKFLALHSLDDNKRYPVATPIDNPDLKAKFEELIQELHDFKLEDPFTPNKNKCQMCIYSQLCDMALT